MADGELHTWMRSMQACHDKHIGGPPPLHQRIAYDAAYAEVPVAEGRLLRRIVSLAKRLAGRGGRQEPQ